MPQDLLNKVRRGLRKPPKVILKRLHQEATAQIERYFAPIRAQRMTLAGLLKKLHQNSLSECWNFLGTRPYCAYINPVPSASLEKFCPGTATDILTQAAQAMEYRVDLLGSGLIELGWPIHWQKDYKSQCDWPMHYMRDIDYNNPERPSDVKFPWEVSRMQWLMPVGQAYLLTQDERYAAFVKDILHDWIIKNPYAQGVNWACTMEVALRILSWTWFFHVFKASHAWQDEGFQQQFLTSLYLHADFTKRHLEYSDINGNHYTADAAGLVFAGLFFGKGDAPKHWLQCGWQILCDELPRQVFSDGVDFEASVPYHRLVLELFFLPALYRQKLGLEVSEAYRQRLCRMAEFVATYHQPNGNVPLWGDADDARALPLGVQDVNDHRYLVAWVGYAYTDQSLLAQAQGSRDEFFWMFGAEAMDEFRLCREKALAQGYEALSPSRAFPLGGFYIMRNARSHVFIDCGPLGLAGRGGHGHNDCLAFEAVLDGVKLISDSGAYLYTASYQERNLFRSTESHNTPCIDGQEINRFIRWDDLWTLHDDAKPQVLQWKPGKFCDRFVGSHTGYLRLADPVTPQRTIVLEHTEHRLSIKDEILCQGEHDVAIPLHFEPSVSVEHIAPGVIILHAYQRQFNLTWQASGHWEVELKQTRISPSYGVLESNQTLVWKTHTLGATWLGIQIEPRMNLD